MTQYNQLPADNSPSTLRKTSDFVRPATSTQESWLFWSASFILLGALALTLGLIWRTTGLASIYSLDDPYIHLAMAEEIVRGNYGVNRGETAAASSSILFPFLLAPLLAAGVGQYAPLLINTVASFGTLFVVSRLASKCEIASISPAFVLIAGIGVVLGFNLVGLVFTGLEHSLHVLVTLTALYGFVRFKEDDRVRVWWIASVVLAPFIRFEGLALPLLVTPFLLGRSRIIPVVVCWCVVGAGMAAWGIAMSRLGLPFLPSSVLVKLNQGNSGSGSLLLGIVKNVLSNAAGQQAAPILVLIAAGLLLRSPPATVLRSIRNCGVRHVGPAVAVFGAGLIVAHVVGGKMGWFYRYEAYALIAGLVAVAITYRDVVKARPRWWQWGVVAPAIGFVLAPYVVGTLKTPAAAANVFAQQYQMHRLAAELLQMPIAVNDLGWVSFRNDGYVLDLWGLGSEEARRARLRAADANGKEWMSELARARGIKVAMMYESWIEAPPDWIKVGELVLAMSRVTAADRTVSIFVLREEDLTQVLKGLEQLQITLPPEASLRILRNSDGQVSRR